MGSLGLKMSEERVDVVFAKTVAWMGGIKRQSHVVKIDFTRDEWQEVGAVIILSLGRHVPGVVGESFIIVINNHEFSFSESSFGGHGVVCWLWGPAWALSITERGSFVHVEPETVVWNFLIEIFETSVPDISSIVAEEIKEYSLVWPNVGDKNSTISFLANIN